MDEFEQRIDFDDDDDVDFVGAPLREEANQRRGQELAEHDRIVKAARDEAWGHAGGEYELNFRATPRWWTKAVNPWATSVFSKHSKRLETIRDVAIVEDIPQQASHAEHLLGQVLGKRSEPWTPRSRQGSRHRELGGDNLLASALIGRYGPDPRAPFVDAMATAGIIPSEPSVIGAGNIVHRFHIIGDEPTSLHGWCILHRCPSAGSFGSLLTGVVHHWHWQPHRLHELEHQFADDVRRASEEINSGTITRFSLSKYSETDRNELSRRQLRPS